MLEAPVTGSPGLNPGPAASKVPANSKKVRRPGENAGPFYCNRTATRTSRPLDSWSSRLLVPGRRERHRGGDWYPDPTLEEITGRRRNHVYAAQEIMQVLQGPLDDE